jgi:hypothetical protein
VVVRVGQPSSPLDHRLAYFVIVQPPDKHAIDRGGGGRPTAASPIIAEWSF